MMTINQSVKYLNKLLEKPNGARPYENYINNRLAGDFCVTISETIKELKKSNAEMLEALIEIYQAQWGEGFSLATLNGVIKDSGKLIENATGQKIEELIK